MGIDHFYMYMYNRLAYMHGNITDASNFLRKFMEG